MRAAPRTRLSARVPFEFTYDLGGGGGGVVTTVVRLLEVGNVPGLSYCLILRSIADAGDCYTGTSEGSAASIMVIWRLSTPFS